MMGSPQIIHRTMHRQNTVLSMSANYWRGYDLRLLVVNRLLSEYVVSAASQIITTLEIRITINPYQALLWLTWSVGSIYLKVFADASLAVSGRMLLAIDCVIVSLASFSSIVSLCSSIIAWILTNILLLLHYPLWVWIIIRTSFVPVNVGKGLFLKLLKITRLLSLLFNYPKSTNILEQLSRTVTNAFLALDLRDSKFCKKVLIWHTPHSLSSGPLILLLFAK